LSDGAIIFDKPFPLSTPLTFPLTFTQIVAPFLADHNARRTGAMVRYRVHDSTSSEVRRVSSFIRNRGFSGRFIGNWMLVAEWRNVPMHEGFDSRRVSIHS
jgi:hypothetical protein